MKGIIRIDTPGISRELDLSSTAPEEVYDKSRQLKDDIQLTDGTPFIVWMQLPSRMNSESFEEIEDMLNEITDPTLPK